MKRLLLSMMSALLVLSAQAQTSFDVGDFKYTILTGTDVSVAAVNENISGNITIPSQVEWNETTYTVKEIKKQGFEYCFNLTSVTIPNTVTTINEGAFYYCSGITSINLGSGVETIKTTAFTYCTGITSLTLPGSVTTIEGSAFTDCEKLESIDLSATSLEKINDYTFNNCSKLSSVKLPNTLTSIGNAAFMRCNIASLDFLTDNVTNIGSSAFQQCRISYIKVKNGTSFAGSAFSQQAGELTVDFSDFPDVPEFISSANMWGSPFGSSPFTDSSGTHLGSLRIIVPIGSVSKYLAHDIMGTIPYHNYRVKFKLGTHTGDTPADVDYSLYNITPQQRLIATSSWKNDYLCFRPEVIFTAEPAINVQAKPTTFEDDKDASGWAQGTLPGNQRKKNVSFPTEEEFGTYVYSNTVDVWDESTHTATPILMTSDVEGVRRIMGAEVPVEHINSFFTNFSFTGSTPDNYPRSLMPYTIHSFHANSGSEEVEQIGRRPVMDGIVPSKTGIVIDFPKPATYLVPPAVYFEDGIPYVAQYEINYMADNMNDVLTNKNWVKLSEISGYDGETGTWVEGKVTYWADFRHPVSSDPLTFKLYEWSEPIDVAQIRDSINSNKYRSVKEYNLDDLNYGYYYGFSWIDIDQYLQDRSVIAKHFNANHNSGTDHNVIIGTPDRYPIFPYWAASPYPFTDAAHDDAEHPEVSQRFNGDSSDPLNFKYAEFGRMGSGDDFVNFVTMKKLNGDDATLDSDIHYVNFGVSKGYFVQVKSKPDVTGADKSKWMQPNRAYFSISRAHMPHIFDGSSSEAKLAIFLEGTDSEPTGIKTVGDVEPETGNDAWYTLQGVRLSQQPIERGIYIHKGKKIVIK